MTKWLLNGCPKCGGDKEITGGEEKCLQCGHITVKTVFAMIIGGGNGVQHKYEPLRSNTDARQNKL